MSMEAPRYQRPDRATELPALTPFEQLRYAREIIQLEADALGAAKAAGCWCRTAR